MARNQNSKKEYLPVEKADIEKYLAETSDDFLFEMKILKILQSAKFQCQHSGYYSDPETSKMREFDIRASLKHTCLELNFAVECKNFSDPLLLIYRTFQQKNKENRIGICGSAAAKHQMERKDCDDNFLAQSSYYVVGFENFPKNIEDDFVGRSSALIKKYKNDKGEEKLECVDDAFERLSQAISSVTEWVQRCQWAIEAHVYLPILVVPDQKLWVADFDDKGETRNLSAVDSCYYYIGKNIQGLYRESQFTYQMPYLRIFTESGLMKFISNHNNLFNELCKDGSRLVDDYK